MPADRQNSDTVMTASRSTRPVVRGKFLWLGGEKIFLRGVTYGPFRPEADGCEYHDRETVARDFSKMAASGINSVRTYTVPPRWLLDLAREKKIWVLVGLPWEQHVAFLDSDEVVRRIEKNFLRDIRACAGHPALLAFAVGNEIPAPVVRWHGPRAIEKFIRRLHQIAKDEDPAALVAYVNYPTTEYLELPCVDLFCFNVFLETPEKFEAYLARLQNLAGDKPLLLTETGLDSRRNGETRQAETLSWEIKLAFTGGCAGLFVFSWTDEWHRGGNDILDWDFGLTRRDRTEKPALAAIRAAFEQLPFAEKKSCPRISVIICTYRGAATLEECLAGLQRVDYPNFEIIVVNDGSDAGVAAIVKKFPVRLLNIPHSGLSAARNAGCAAATGEIVAYLDDDAWPDPHWLQFLAHAFSTTDCAAVGGPNIPPHTENSVTRSIAHAPGGPIHVLLTDREAEHIPGCNMAFRKSALEKIGGFDTQFWVAGDDVDICWRFHDAGLKIGFHPGAMVWHHRRRKIYNYFKQQSGYGRAEAMLEKKWPAKYNAAGQPAWHGRIYGLGRLAALTVGKQRIYHGTWGSALFQSLYEPAPSTFWSAARMPEWYVLIFALAVLVALAPFWNSLFWITPLLAIAIAIPVIQAVLQAQRLPLKNFFEFALVAFLNLLQPLARLHGRVVAGLTPWGRRRLDTGFVLPLPAELRVWSEQWRSPNDWLAAVESPLLTAGAVVSRGGDYDRWDLQIFGGVMGGVRLQLLAEEHGQEKQNVRFRVVPDWSDASLITLSYAAVLTFGAALDAAWVAASVFGVVTLICLVAMFVESAAAMALTRKTIDELKSGVKGAKK
jgi:glycosyltransferase involved in cell wall biosynthesis